MESSPQAPAPAIAADAGFQLTPPEVITPVGEQVAKSAVPMAPELRAAVEDQVGRFMDGLLAEDVNSEAFKARLDSAFALGREEVSIASSLMQGRLLQRNFVGMEDTTAFKAIQDMRGHLDDLNPGKQGDLFQPQKLLGIIPYGNKLQSYFRKYQSASGQLQKSMQQLYSARDDMQRDVVDIEATRGKLWDAMQKLSGAIHFAETLDARLAAKVEALKATDAPRAKALEQEVLFYTRQNLQDMLTQQAVCTNGYLALDVLKKTGREMMNGCSRVATTGHERPGRRADGRARHGQPDPGDGDAHGREQHHRGPDRRERAPAEHARREDDAVRAEPDDRHREAEGNVRPDLQGDGRHGCLPLQGHRRDGAEQRHHQGTAGQVRPVRRPRSPAAGARSDPRRRERPGRDVIIQHEEKRKQPWRPNI